MAVGRSATGARGSALQNSRHAIRAPRAPSSTKTPGANDWFGESVALSADGSTLAVGAIFEDSASSGVNNNQTNDLAWDSGAVYVHLF